MNAKKNIFDVSTWKLLQDTTEKLHVPSESLMRSFHTESLHDLYEKDAALDVAIMSVGEKITAATTALMALDEAKPGQSDQSFFYLNLIEKNKNGGDDVA